ncbi:hypothetical protein H8K32_02580 [Undibacterium jejuense]|uniref:Uncharacterized protein n=1 Tax=Undibacterium jejuense TaxID=1344949 RepID=A0A923HEM3_9BURK|nr:hypothetical protein [Undibacterium jejuense]MBC3860973.1 hypothetical protein [Undibacterium jejuense]
MLTLTSTDWRQSRRYTEQFSRWVMANKHRLPELVKRRAAERSLFLLPV